jgi:hypothetical protein
MAKKSTSWTESQWQDWAVRVGRSLDALRRELIEPAAASAIYAKHADKLWRHSRLVSGRMKSDVGGVLFRYGGSRPALMLDALERKRHAGGDDHAAACGEWIDRAAIAIADRVDDICFIALDSVMAETPDGSPDGIDLDEVRNRVAAAIAPLIVAAFTGEKAEVKA